MDTNGARALVNKFADKSRGAPTKDGNQYILRHKFTPKGDVIDNSNFEPRRDISRLSLDDFKLLAALQEKNWDQKAACESINVDLATAQKRLKKLSYFEFEDKKSQALAAIVNPAFVTAKN